MVLQDTLTEVADSDGNWFQISFCSLFRIKMYLQKHSIIFFFILHIFFEEPICIPISEVLQFPGTRTADQLRALQKDGNGVPFNFARHNKAKLDSNAEAANKK